MGLPGPVGPDSMTQRPVHLSGQDVAVSLSNAEGRRFRLELPAFDLAPGARLALTGDNGSGKTTALSLLGLVRMPERAVKFQFQAGRRIHALRPPWRGRQLKAVTALRRRHIAQVQHAGREIDFLTVRERIRLHLSMAGCRNKAGRIEMIAHELGLQALLRRKPAALSQGQRQRLALATAIAMTPGLILADEPTAALDREWSDRALGQLSALADNGSIVIISTHDPEAARRHGFSVISTRLEADPRGQRAILDLGRAI